MLRLEEPQLGERRHGDPPRVAIGIIHYRTYEELPSCLEALASQTLPPCGVVVIDADGDADRRARLTREFPDVAFLPQPNRGYAGGANAAVAWAEERHPEAPYVLLLNSDVRLGPDFIAELSAAMGEHPGAALGTGKLLRPNGVLDSAGISLPLHRRPRDRGSGQPDRGQYDRKEPVFGASGAAMMIRRSAIHELCIQGELFDEDFFVYHEDTDLSWRCHNLGWDVLYVPQARAIHDRRWRAERRFEVALEVRRHSFKNHYLQLVKNERPRDFFVHLPWLLAWEGMRLGFALLRDPEILPAYVQAARLLGSAWDKRRRLGKRGPARHQDLDLEGADP